MFDPNPHSKSPADTWFVVDMNEEKEVGLPDAWFLMEYPVSK